MKLKYCLLSASVIIAAHAQATDLDSGVYIAPSLTHQNYGGNVLGDDFNLESEIGFSFGVGYQFDSPWAVEFTYTSVDTELTSGGVDADTEYLHLDGYYHFEDSNDNNWSSYLVAGIGQQSFEADNYDESDLQLNAGYGIKYLFSSNFYARTDLRATLGAEDSDVGTLFNIGLVYIFGGSSSSNAPTKANPSNTQPTKEGAEKVEEVVSAAVIVADKAADVDSDGVSDDEDKCLDTKAGAKVDESGCNEVLEEAKEFTLNVTFKTNSSEINKSSTADIKALAEFLTSYPDTVVTIEGHSDSVGVAAYNKTLSQKRANAVKGVLASDYNIEAERVSAVGFGEEQPISDNATSEGRDKNRRVVASVSNKK